MIETDVHRLVHHHSIRGLVLGPRFPRLWALDFKKMLGKKNVGTSLGGETVSVLTGGLGLPQGC